MPDTIYNPAGMRKTWNPAISAESDTHMPPLVSESRNALARELRRMARAIRAMTPADKWHAERKFTT